MAIREPYRTILLTTLLFLVGKNFLIGFLLTDLMSFLKAFIHLGLVYLIRQNHPLSEWAIRAWAIIYLLIFTGINAGAKTLVILRGDAWEIDTMRYCIDLVLVAVGLLVLIFSGRIFPSEH